MTELLTPAVLLEKLPQELSLFQRVKKRRGSRERLRILVVEDQLFSRKLLFEVLRGTYDVDLAETAFEGLKLYLENAPDISFLDIELEGESGHILARIIREFDPEAFIAMVTGNNSARDVAFAKSNNVACYITKPYSKGKIQEAIDGYFVLHPAPLPEGTIP